MDSDELTELRSLEQVIQDGVGLIADKMEKIRAINEETQKVATALETIR
jgi:hypothetical protein